jgi:hypothetical protein
MDIKINIETDNLKLDPIKFQKMLLLFNTIEDGWAIKKKDNAYIFTKNHENKKEIFDDTYLLKFMKTNLNLNKIIS